MTFRDEEMKLLDEALPHCDDVQVVVGLIPFPPPPESPRTYVPMVQVVFGSPFVGWPEKMTALRVLEPASMCEMFYLVGTDKPEEVGMPLAAVVWEEYHQKFFDYARQHKFFIVEVVDPKKQRRAVVHAGTNAVEELFSRPITSEEYRAAVESENIRPPVRDDGPGLGNERHG